ncbi:MULTISPECIES: PilW family protein [Acinetobacter]|jgi:type IV pilus assembly protein PilW|uniref:PilW family protein n=1 Tax=Acinetobacter TaxID=469 RepID=UPI00132F6D87|nr:PilW family protein [Acinetobacter johnsonii]MDH1240377.1 PilW family protein [Acinetobacter johnsonii]MDH1725333.1 PilW family protein [Acinetobacter johnsonii]
MKRKMSGYTLVELMVALVLGLIVVLVAVQMLLAGQRSVAFQNAVLNVQDNANIGLNYIVTDLKHTNLNLINRDMRSTGVSGLIVSDSNYPANITTNRRLSSTADSNSPSLTEDDSDVLVIQYRPNLAKGYDCEGEAITSPNDVIVQRYFLRRDTNGANFDLALACDAGRYANTETETTITGFNNSGQIIMQRVDQFKVLVGVQNTSTRSLSYMTLAQFAAVPAGENLRAVSLQIGILARSLDNAGADTNEKLDYTLLNLPQVVDKPDEMKARYVRVPVEQTIALKNGLGERL